MPGVTLKAVGSTESVTSKEDGTFDMMVSPYAKFVEASKEDFISVRLEIDGSYLVFRLALDKRYIEAKAKAEEQARLAAAAAAEAEKARIEEERRIAAEKAAAEREAMLRAEQERLAAEARAKAEEERRIAAEKAAAEKARIAEEKRIAAEKAAAEKAEAARLAAEEKARIAEEKRIAAEKAAAEKAEAARIAAEEKKRQEEEKARLAEEKRLAAEKAAAEKAEQDRLAAEERSKLAEKERLAAAEKARVVAEAERAKRAEAERLAAEEKARIAEAKRIAAEKAAAEKQKKVDARNAYVKKWKDAKLKGYRSQVEALFALDFDLMCNCNVHYIGGFQINNLFYVGVGAGVSLYLNDVETPRWSKTDYIDAANLPLNLWSIPVFGYFRANFANRRLTPFFALAAGYRFGTKHTFDMPWDSYAEYSTSGIFINPQIGLNFRMTKKSDIYITGGFNFMQMPQFDAANSTMFEAKFYNQFYRGFDLRLGFTF